MKAIEAETITEAFAKGFQYVNRPKGGGEADNVILSISEPWRVDPRDQKFIDDISAHSQTRKVPKHSVETVADWIFPWPYYEKYGSAGIHEKYLEDFEHIRNIDNHNKWGIYIQRLISLKDMSKKGSGWVFQEDDAGNRIDPLRLMIDQMKNAPGRGNWKNCYELALYRTAQDWWRPRALPCLSHLSFKIRDHGLDLTALYRNQDYRHKLMGNLLGLARLQAYVASEVGCPIGQLVVHSVSADIATDAGKPELKALVAAFLDDVNAKAAQAPCAAVSG